MASAGPPADTLVVPGLRHRIEAMLLDAGRFDMPDALKAQLQRLAAHHFAPGEVVRATEVASRYVDYRVAVGKLAAPADISDPRALQAALAARQEQRRRYFTQEERDALFAQEEELDRYTIARLEIVRNDSLPADQKQQALRVAEAELGQAQRTVRQEMVQHEAVAAQTAALDVSGASEHQRYAQRSAAYGDGAAQRLADLDREERDWQGRLHRYAAAQTAGNTQSAAALRQQLFSDSEQLRLDAALALKTSRGR